MNEAIFKFGGPLPPELFYNREKEVKFLLARLSEIKKGVQHNFALVGPRRIGKSSVIDFLGYKLKKEGIIPITLDCEGREIAKHLELSLEMFLSAYGNSIIDAYVTHAKLGSKIKIRLRDFIIGAKDRIIAALAEILGTAKALEIKTLSDYLTLRVEFEKLPKPSEKEIVKLLEDTLSLSEKLGKENDIFFVIMLDEFQYTAKFTKPINFLQAFRRQMQRQRRTAYVLSGSSMGMMENILQSTPFGGHIPIEWIDVFDNNIAKKFFKEGVKKAKRIIENHTIEKIAAYANNHPAYLNWFGEQCCKEVAEGEKITLELIAKLQERIFEKEGLMHIFETDLAKISPRGGKPLHIFIEMAGHDLSSPTEISKQTSRITPSEIIIYLKRLEKKGYVRKIDVGNYKIVDDMLKNYVKRKVHTTI